jgi:proline dehydrogenase
LVVNLLDRAVVGLLPLVPKPIVRRFSSRYIAGDSIADAVRLIRGLNARGMMATLDVLGEFITRKDEAEATCRAYEEALRVITDERLDSNISVKLTSMGLLLDEDFCFSLMDRLCRDAAARGIFVRLDMEDSNCTDRTLQIYRKLRAAGFDHVGIVLQAYMRRSLGDIEGLLPLKPNVRVCKGIYIEPREIAYQEHDEINDNFKLMVDTLLANGCYTGIATHDDELVQAGYDTVKRLGLQKEKYEFQMLLGVREELRQSIVDQGHRLRVYVPYGAKWYAYSVRRLKENPRIAGYVFRNLLGKISGNGTNGRLPESK